MTDRCSTCSKVQAAEYFEETLNTMRKTITRLWVWIIILIAIIVVSNACWFYYWGNSISSAH